MKPFFKIILIFLALKGIWCPSIAQTHVKNIYKLIDSAGEMGSQAKYEKAIVLFEKANKIIKDNKIKITDSFYLGKLINGAAMSYIEQGKIYAGVHDISKMKWHFDNAKKWWKIMLRDSTENISMLLFINGILANANNQLDNEEENMAILKEVQPYEAHLSLTNFFRYCMLLNSISSSLLQLGNTDSAANILINKEALLDTFINVYHVKQDAETGIYIEDIHLMLINQLAQVYQSKGDIINADRFYSKALNIIRKTKKIDEVTYLNVITFYDKKGEHKKSQELLDEVKNLIIKNEGKGTKRYLDILMAEADIYFDIGNFKKVLKILEEALPIATRSNEPRLVEFIYQLFGKAYFELEDIENGKKYYREIIKHHIAFFGKQSSKLPSLLIDFSLELQPFDLNYSFIIAKEAEGYVIKNKWEATQQALDIYSRLAHYYQWDYIKKGPIKKEKDKYLIDTAILYAQKAVALSEKYYSKTSFNHLQYLSNLASIVSIGNNNTQSLNINKQIIKTYEISSIVNRRFYAGQMLSVALDYNSLHKLDSTLFYLTKMITIVKEDIKDRNFKLFSSGYENYDFLNDKFNTADLYSYMLCDSIPGITQFSFNNQLFKKSVYLKNATYVLKNLRKRLNSNSEEAFSR